MPGVMESVAEMQRFADAARQQGKRIALVPTMGALHEGHLSLIRLAAAQADVIVCSIFVNPTQFGPAEDFTSYPRMLEDDIRKATEAGATAVFAPAVRDMYTEDHQTFVVNDSIGGILEGKERPGHFRGVATVVLKLLTAAKPHIAVFGQKDAQQLAVIRTMVRDLGIDVAIVSGPIVREPDGLAMSSRNVYLDTEQRRQAVVLNKALVHAESLVRNGVRSLEEIKNAIRREVDAGQPTGVDYVEAVHPDTFRVLEEFQDTGTLIVLVVRFGSTRLLDNRLLHG